MQIELLPLDDLEADDRLYIKGLKLSKTVKIDYETSKHVSFIIEGDESQHSVMYFAEKSGSKRWQCDCKWYTLQNKTCSHIIAANIAIKNSLVLV